MPGMLCVDARSGSMAAWACSITPQDRKAAGMNRFNLVVALAAVCSLGVGAAASQMPGMDMPMQTGRVAFQNSCSPRIGTSLNAGVSALYSFWFAESHQLFERATREEPDCAIAYWGVAMSDYEQIEGHSLPEGTQLADGQAAIARGEAAGRKTPREAAYLKAIAIIFDATGIPDHDQRVQLFSAAMGAIASSYPGDRQAAVLYAMSLLKDGMPPDPGLIRARKALTILNGVLRAEPENPGVIHFIIHAADNPRMASFGLEAARRYARIAPAALMPCTCQVISSPGLASGMKTSAPTWHRQRRLRRPH